MVTNGIFLFVVLLIEFCQKGMTKRNEITWVVQVFYCKLLARQETNSEIQPIALRCTHAHTALTVSDWSQQTTLCVCGHPRLPEIQARLHVLTARAPAPARARARAIGR